MTDFITKLQQRWQTSNSLLCVGLDPLMARLPAHLQETPDAFYQFSKAIIDATAPWVCAFKPQIAYYAAQGAEACLKRTIGYIRQHYADIPVILDAKRGDIGSTAEQYAVEAFERYLADAVTVNPYMGGDTFDAYFRYQDRGVVLLCLTSNPGSADLQRLHVDQNGIQQPLYEVVAQSAASKWNPNNNTVLVVGATHPEELGRIRHLVGSMPILVPGIGAQGGDLAQVLKQGLDPNRSGLIINVGRSIIYAGEGLDFAHKAAFEAEKYSFDINNLRN